MWRRRRASAKSPEENEGRHDARGDDDGDANHGDKGWRPTIQRRPEDNDIPVPVEGAIDGSRGRGEFRGARRARYVNNSLSVQHDPIEIVDRGPAKGCGEGEGSTADPRQEPVLVVRTGGSPGRAGQVEGVRHAREDHATRGVRCEPPGLVGAGAAKVRAVQEMIAHWQKFLDESQSLLAGKTLAPFWRGDGGKGVNLRKVFTEPTTLDPVLWIQGTAAAPYLEQGNITDPNTWKDIWGAFGRQSFLGFAVWFN